MVVHGGLLCELRTWCGGVAFHTYFLDSIVHFLLLLFCSKRPKLECLPWKACNSPPQSCVCRRSSSHRGRLRRSFNITFFYNELHNLSCGLIIYISWTCRPGPLGLGSRCQALLWIRCSRKSSPQWHRSISLPRCSAWTEDPPSGPRPPRNKESSQTLCLSCALPTGKTILCCCRTYISPARGDEEAKGKQKISL